MILWTLTEKLLLHLICFIFTKRKKIMQFCTCDMHEINRLFGCAILLPINFSNDSVKRKSISKVIKEFLVAKRQGILSLILQ